MDLIILKDKGNTFFRNVGNRFPNGAVLPVSIHLCRLCDMQTHVEAIHSSSLIARSQAAEATWEISQAECYQNSSHVLFGYGVAFLLHKRFDIPQRKLFLAVHHCWEASALFRYSLQLEKNCGKQSAVFSNVVHSHREDVERCCCRATPSRWTSICL